MYNNLKERLKYFDGIRTIGRTLIDEASKLLDNAKDLQNAIDRTLKTLELNYSPEEIAEEFGDDDADWLKDYTDQFLDDCNLL